MTAAKYNLLEKEYEEFKESTAEVHHGLDDTVISLQTSIDEKVEKHHDIRTEVEGRLEEVNARLTETRREGQEAVVSLSASLLDRVERMRQVEATRNTDTVERLEKMEQRIVECFETNSGLKAGISENRRWCEEHEETFKNGLRAAEKRTTEAFILIEKLKVNHR